ncbi:hypothetical protein ABZP36_009682 [Zizania latifolia]
MAAGRRRSSSHIYGLQCTGVTGHIEDLKYRTNEQYNATAPQTGGSHIRTGGGAATLGSGVRPPGGQDTGGTAPQRESPGRQSGNGECVARRDSPGGWDCDLRAAAPIRETPRRPTGFRS